jgi:hypothetical protein
VRVVVYVFDGGGQYTGEADLLTTVCVVLNSAVGEHGRDVCNTVVVCVVATGDDDLDLMILACSSFVDANNSLSFLKRLI